MSKLFIDIFSIFAILLMVGVLVLIFIKKPKKLNQSLLWFFLPTFFIAFSLFTISSIYNNSNLPLFYEIIRNFIYSLSLFALRINEKNVTELVNANTLYAIAVTFVYFLAACNIVLDVTLVLFSNLHNNNLIKKYGKGSHYILLGSAKSTYEFAKRLDFNTIIILDKNEENKDFIKDLKNNKIAYILSSNIKNSLLKAKIESKDCIVISMHENSKINIDNSIVISSILPNYNKAYILCDNINNKEFYNVNQKNIVYFNNDVLIAQNFLNRYHLLEFLPEGYIDSKKAMLTDKSFNNIFIGFSNSSEALLELLMLNYQFIDKSFNVSIYDKNALNIKDLLKSKYYANEKIKLIDSDLYYDQLPVQNNINTYDIDEQSLDFKLNVLDKLNDYTFFYIDVSSDSINIEKALAIQKYLNNINKKDYTIFVKITDHLNFDIKSLNDKNIYLYGEYEKIFAKQIIIDQKLDDLAKSVNYYYYINYQNDGKSKDEAWNETSLLNKNSSRCSANNIIVKLNLLGLKLSLHGDFITKDEYLKIYNDNKPLNRDLNIDINYKYDNKRINLGILEHLRWNTFEILNNHMPMDKNDILNKNKKAYIRKIPEMNLHSNITSLKGLFDLENDIRKCQFLDPDLKNKESCILIKDFDTMDNLYEIISYSEYKIVKR